MALRLAILGLVCAVLGAVTTVGVAWGLAWKAEPLTAPVVWHFVSDIAGRKDAVRVSFRRRPGAEIVMSQLWPWPNEHGEAALRPVPTRGLDPAVLPAWCRMEIGAFLQWGVSDYASEYAVEARGWPAMALACEHWFPLQTSHAIQVGPKTRGFEFPVALPLRPIWRGLALDTAFYAGVWFLLLFVPSGAAAAVRRAVRRRRGQCPRCGYDMRGLAGCPECGVAAAAR